MRRFFIPVFLFVIGTAFLSSVCIADGNRTLTILYTGDISGQITPLNG